MRVILALTAAVLALTAVGSAAGQPSAARATTVKVTATDFHFKLSTSTVNAGRVNSSPALHDFKIAGHTSQTIGSGKTTRLTMTLKPGRYLYACTVDSHAELGRKGHLRVAR